MLYSCTYMATVGVKGLTWSQHGVNMVNMEGCGHISTENSQKHPADICAATLAELISPTPTPTSATTCDTDPSFTTH